MQELISKAAVLLEALPYIQKFNGETFVVKYGGSFMDSPDAAVRNGVARDIVFLEAVEINPVVAHGGIAGEARKKYRSWCQRSLVMFGHRRRVLAQRAFFPMGFPAKKP